MKKVIYFLILFLLPISVLAKNQTEDEFNIVCDKKDNININEQIICRVSVKSDFLYNKVSFNLEDLNGLEIIDIRSNYEKIWNIQNNDNKVTANAEELQSGLQEFGIILLKAVKSGVYNIAIENISLIDTSTADIKNLDSTFESIKIISTDNLLKGIYINDSSIEGFNSNTVNYEYYINDETSIKIAAEGSNEFSVIDGVGEFAIDPNVEKSLFPIKVTSEDGACKIYVINVIRKDFIVNDIDKKIDNIVIKNDKGNNILFNFNSDVYEYNIDVDINTNYLEIKPILDNDNVSFVKSFGEQKVNLDSGANIVIIKVQDQQGQILNYILNITKPIANKSDNNYIKSLIIKKYKLSFSKRVKNYTLEISSNDSSLDIIPTLESPNATYTIMGNNNLKDGSAIKIIVTAENEEKQIYTINIKVKNTNYSTNILIGLGLIIATYLLFNKYKELNKQKLKNLSSKNNKSKKHNIANNNPTILKTKSSLNNNVQEKTKSNKKVTNKTNVSSSKSNTSKVKKHSNNKSTITNNNSNKKKNNNSTNNNTYKPQNYTKKKTTGTNGKKKSGKTNYKKKKKK